MKGYVDLFLIPLPKKNLSRYRREARLFGKMAREYGALDYREFTGDDLFVKGVQSFAKKKPLKKGDCVIAAITGFTSRSHRDMVMKKLFEDPRMEKMMNTTPLFNAKQMVYGGFRTIVHV